MRRFLYSLVMSFITPLMLILAANASHALVIMQYHHISDETPASTSTSPELFAQHMQYVEEQGFEVLSLSAVRSHIESGIEFPVNSVLITFDDAYESIYQQAFPILKEKGWPFTIFISTEAINVKAFGMLSWQQLNEMAESGASLANHTVSHPHLVRKQKNETDQQWLQRITNEIEIAESEIKKHTGQNHKMVAYPYGEFNAEVLSLLKQKGYYAMGQHSGAASIKDKYAMPRFPLSNAFGQLESLPTKMNSLPLEYKNLQVLSDQRKPMQDGILPSLTTRPIVQLELNNQKQAKAIQCYVSGQGLADKLFITPTLIEFRAPRNLSAGRNRYNCTASSGIKGKFFWLSVPFISKTASGEWAPE